MTRVMTTGHHTCLQAMTATYMTTTWAKYITTRRNQKKIEKVVMLKINADFIMYARAKYMTTTSGVKDFDIAEEVCRKEGGGYICKCSCSVQISYCARACCLSSG